MLRLMVYSAVVLAHVATGAPSARNAAATSSAAPASSPPQNHPIANQIKPASAAAFAEEERELESLKHVAHGETQIHKNNNTEPTTTSSSTVPAKLPANEEHPAPSDNDNDNLERLFGPPLSIRSAAAFPFESEEAALKAKKSGFGPGAGSYGGVADEFILGENFSVGEMDVTAKDVAEYIYWTEDEDSVTAALQGSLDAGLVSKEKMLGFLTEVQDHLQSLFRSRNRERQDETLEYEQGWKPNHVKPVGYNLFKNGGDKRSSQMDFDVMRGGGAEALFDYPPPPQAPRGFKASAAADTADDEEQDLIMDDLVWRSEMDRLARMEDAQLREDNLQDVVYSIAKKLFQEELQEKPQKSIQRMATFSQQLGASLPADLNRAVHDSLTRALVDAVAEEAKTWARDQIVSKELELAVAAIPLTRDSMTSEKKPKGGRQGFGSGTPRKM